MNDELIMWTLANLMKEVEWNRSPPNQTPDLHKFITISRRVKLFADVPADAQPACYQAEWSVDEQQVSNMPYKTTMGVNWIIYHCVGKDKSAIGAIENNLILRAVRDTLAPKVTDPGWPKRNTLGGLVHHCFISGRVFKDPGDIDDQAMMVVPIKLLVP